MTVNKIEVSICKLSLYMSSYDCIYMYIVFTNESFITYILFSLNGEGVMLCMKDFMSFV